jgi:hypothetical protein
MGPRLEGECKDLHDYAQLTFQTIFFFISTLNKFKIIATNKMQFDKNCGVLKFHTLCWGEGGGDKCDNSPRAPKTSIRH